LEARANQARDVRQTWNIARGSIYAAAAGITAPSTDAFNEVRLSVAGTPVVQETSVRAEEDASHRTRLIAEADVIAKKETFAGLHAVTGPACLSAEI
jgi:hypothetical protein